MMKTIFEGKHIDVLERDGWEFVERKKAKEAVAVVARTGAEEIVLTEQFRRPVNAIVIDWPAGLVGDESDRDDAVATARKELEEETGYVCERVELLARGPSSPGITSEIVSFYRATGIEKRSHGGGVGGEQITVHLVARAHVRDWLARREREGCLVDLKIWGGLYFIDRD